MCQKPPCGDNLYTGKLWNIIRGM